MVVAVVCVWGCARGRLGCSVDDRVVVVRVVWSKSASVRGGRRDVCRSGFGNIVSGEGMLKEHA